MSQVQIDDYNCPNCSGLTMANLDIRSGKYTCLKCNNSRKKLTRVFTAHRVGYGKKLTPIKDKEYNLIIGGSRIGPVGTKKEWREYAKENGIRIKFKERK